MAADHGTSLRQRKKDATQQAIADAAWELFDERGYHDTSINDIAERANVAPRTFFRYFPTKDAVVYPEFDELLRHVRTAFAARPTDEPVMASLISALETLTDSMNEETSRNQARLHLMKGVQGEAVGEYFRKRLTDEVEALVLEREAGSPDADLRAKLASGVIGLIIDTSREHWVQTGATEALPDVGQRCISLMHELLATNTRT
ncbi:MAG: TetR family transcriptional regulator [Ilumatobacteraceae bacterium]|nr:TetR family transcriptional regulator [Ilumatobacteraceae bacterium]